ncbi:hypothetical protein GQ457_14G025350 [Hibiscus cannabinus]
MASSSSSRQQKYQVFLSFRGPDTRLGFTSHLLEALKGKGLDVFFDQEKLQKGYRISPELSQAIAASNLSIIVLSRDYASSNSCLAELSDIMDRNRTQGHVLIPIFYKVEPSDVRHLGGNFEKSFDLHDSEGLKQVQQWKAAFTEVGKLIGWHIKGDKSDRSEAEYIKDIVEDVIKKLMNGKSRSSSEQLVGIDDQKKIILDLIEQKNCRIIGLWGAGGIGKTTLADAIYKEVSTEFESCWFLQNVREKIKNQGRESLRNELLSKLLNQKDVRIETPSIGTPYLERLNNRHLFVVLDDVSDPDHIEFMGVGHFGHGSKIIVTSRDRQVLKIGGADKIYKVDKFNENDSLRLFSTIALKQSNSAADFRDLSNKFVRYADGNPLALKVLGSKLYTKSRGEWENELIKLKEYAEPKLSQILKSSFDALDEVDKNIFLDIAIFFKGESKKDVKEILNCCYKVAVSGINNLIDKCLLNILYKSFISMHDMLEEMGKDIVRGESKDPRMRSRLWTPKDVYQILKYNKGTDLIQGVKLDMTQIDNLQLCSTVFEKMHNLKYIHFGVPWHLRDCWKAKLLADGVENIFLPEELRYLSWDYYPFRSLSSFNPKNLVILKLCHDNIEELWNEDDHLIPILRSEVLGSLVMARCERLRLLSELPPYLGLLDAHGCMSLENVSFMDQNLYRYHSSVEDDDEDAYDVFFLLFSNCFSLNQDSVDNIEANAILNIGSLAKRWASRYDSDCATECIPRLVCCFPGNRISADKFEHRSVNSSINLDIDSNGCSRSRFLGFAVCLVADLTPCHDHVLILSSIEMVTKDENYVEASFKFYIRSYENSVDETVIDNIEVKKCGVHVFYVDAESDTYGGWPSNGEASDSFSSTESSNSDELSNDESNRNLDSREDVNDTEMRHGGKRRLSCDAEEGDGEPKRLK